MATWLNEYQKRKSTMTEQLHNGTLKPGQIIQYQELSYRIEVLETCQAFCKTAPITVEIPTMAEHYKLVDAYIQCLEKERRLGQPADEKQKAKRATASEALSKVILDCRKRFSSFTPNGPEHYRKDIHTMVNTILPVWLQFRNTYTQINK